MNNPFRTGLLSLAVLVGWFLALAPAHAQQNLFNIPSGTLTTESDLFYQHQVNVYATRDFVSKQHFVFGLGDQWEVGANLVNFSIFKGDPAARSLPTKGISGTRPVGPIIAGTVQKGWTVGSAFSLNVGTQAGVTHASSVERSALTQFTYGLVAYQSPDSHLRLVGGAWVSDSIWMGFGHSAGLMLGYEIPLSRTFSLMGDWISGDTESSVAVLGAMVNLSKTTQVCLGWLIPSPGSPAKQALVLELNLFTL